MSFIRYPQYMREDAACNQLNALSLNASFSAPSFDRPWSPLGRHCTDNGVGGTWQEAVDETDGPHSPGRGLLSPPPELGLLPPVSSAAWDPSSSQVYTSDSSDHGTEAGGEAEDEEDSDIDPTFDEHSDSLAGLLLFAGTKQKAEIFNSEGIPYTVKMTVGAGRKFKRDPQTGASACYRRNYINATIEFQFVRGASSGTNADGTDSSDDDTINDGMGTSTGSSRKLFVMHEGRPHQITGTSVYMTASIDRHDGEAASMLQRTTKGKRKEQGGPRRIKVVPLAPGSFYATHADPDAIMPELQFQAMPFPTRCGTLYALSTVANYERLCFTRATAGNGFSKREQQYYYLLAMVFVDIRETPEEKSRWILVACKPSGRIICRGKGPKHYREAQENRQQQQKQQRGKNVRNNGKKGKNSGKIIKKSGKVV